jgi:hypothetical protein
MPLLPPQYLDAVVAIGTGKSSARSWIGTGFFYGVPTGKADSKGNNFYTIFLITNRHVLAGIRQACIRLNSQADNSSKEYNIDLLAKNGKPIWVAHPDDDVDIVALWINAGFLDTDSRRYSFFAEDTAVIDSSMLTASPISEGDGVFILGYPMGMVGDRHYVICRSGSIGRIRHVKEGSGKEILLDGLVFPGNSGGPVITKPELVAIQGQEPFKSAHLLGIVTSYIPYQDIAISNQTKRPRIIFEENSGLSAIHPAQLIIETVAEAHKRHRNRIAQAKHRVKRKSTEQNTAPDS